MPEYDIVVNMPPKEKYTITLEVLTIRKAQPNIAKDVNRAGEKMMDTLEIILVGVAVGFQIVGTSIIVLMYIDLKRRYETQVALGILEDKGFWLWVFDR